MEKGVLDTCNCGYGARLPRSNENMTRRLSIVEWLGAVVGLYWFARFGHVGRESRLGCNAMTTSEFTVDALCPRRKDGL